MTQVITVNLPDALYKQLERAAELSHQPLETIVAQSLAYSLPLLLEDIPAEYQADVYPLLQMSDADLQREARRVFSPDRWAEYEALLNRKKSESLTAEEQARLNALRREADVLTFRKGYAAVLLKRRGYRLPALRETVRSSGPLTDLSRIVSSSLPVNSVDVEVYMDKHGYEQVDGCLGF